VAGRSRQVKCRIYIVYYHALFAQGIRSLLHARRAIQVVGMESDPNKALEAVAALRPEVVIVEESDAGVQSSTLGAILERHPMARVVALDLDHNFATVYDRHCVITTQPSDLVKAIRGDFRDRELREPARAPGAVRADSIHKDSPTTLLRGKGRRQR
jgi:chemotaxis response regulator CheB